jgi:putative DNA primase/helicase
MSAAGHAHAFDSAPADDRPLDRELKKWQGQIAVAGANGHGLDVYKAALHWAQQTVPPDNGLLEKAKQEIREAAERHLTDVHGASVVDVIYLAVFADDALSTHALDADVLCRDRANEANAEIEWLTKLSTIEYDRQRKASAEKLGISLKALDAEVKAARAENGYAKGQGRPFELPEIEPWPGPVVGSELLESICAAQRRYLVLPNGSAETLALWAVHTHVFRCFEHTPRLALTSPEKRCGKTTTLDVLAELVASPFSTSNISAAAVFRVVEKFGPTLLIDEADAFLPERDELRGILNDGHKRGGQTVRLVGDDHEPRLFSTFSPAAIAMIGRLSDTLADRAVNVRLRRKRPNEPVQLFRSNRIADLHELRQKMARWALDHQKKLASADPSIVTLFNRAADNWRPLLAIADAAGGDWPTMARSIAEAAECAKQDQSIKAMLLSDIREIIAEKSHTDRIASVELATKLGDMEGRPWAE